MRRVLARRLTIEGPREVGGDIEAGLLGVHAGPARDLQCRHFVADSSAEGGEGALLQQILGRAADDARGALCGDADIVRGQARRSLALRHVCATMASERVTRSTRSRRNNALNNSTILHCIQLKA